MRYTDDELELIKRTYAGESGELLLKLLRKTFLPELDPSLPVGQMLDLWMTVKIDDMSPQDALINLKSRNTLIAHLELQLMQLKILANQDSSTPKEKAEKILKDSSK